MTPFDCLTDKDLDLINEYIDRFALGYEEYPSCSRNTDLEYILRYWNEAKGDHLFKMFGEKLILEKEETLVYSCLDFYAKSVEQIYRETNLTLIQILSALNRLVELGLAKECFTNQYTKIH